MTAKPVTQSASAGVRCENCVPDYLRIIGVEQSHAIPTRHLQGATIRWPFACTRDTLGHSSVQPWSAGAVFPCIISTVERYPVRHYRVMCEYAKQSQIFHCDGTDGAHAVAAVLATETAHGAVRAYVLSDEPGEGFTSYMLSLDGHSEEYATWDDAERVARALLDSPAMRASWRGEQ